MRVAVVDYGMGNLHSVSKAVEHVAPHASVEVTSDPAYVAGADRVVFPGQGAMPDCIREMDPRGFAPAGLGAPRSRPLLWIRPGYPKPSYPPRPTQVIAPPSPTPQD